MEKVEKSKTLLLYWGAELTSSGSAAIVRNLVREVPVTEIALVGLRIVGRDNQLSGIKKSSEAVRIFLGLPPEKRGAAALRRLFSPALAFSLRRLIKKLDCKNVIAVYPDDAFLFAGWLAAKMTGCDFFTYFHNTYLENMSGRRLSFARWLQPRVFRDSKHIFVMSDGMLNLFRNKYPDNNKISSLRHTFNEVIPAYTGCPVPTSGLKVVMVGNITESCLDAAQRMVEAVRRVPGAKLEYFSGMSKSQYEDYGMWSDGFSCETLNRQDLLRRLSEFDILFLPHGFTGERASEEYETIFPTRTIEYLISGKPILAHSPPKSFLTKFLNDNGCALVVEDMDLDALVRAIDRLTRDEELRSSLVRNALETARMFTASEVLGHLRTILK